MGVTIVELAKICGVSKSTVVRALHNEGRINKETKQMIIDKANELHYQPNLLARSLVSGKSRIIGIMIPDLHNQYFPKIVDSVIKQVLPEGYLVNVMIHNDSKENEKRIMESLVSYNVDGIILDPVIKGNALSDMLNTIDIPSVILGTEYLEDHPSVGIDEKQAAIEATEYIISKGYTNLVLVSPPLYDSDHDLNPGHNNRRVGFVQAAQKANVNYEVIPDTDFVSPVLERMKRGGHPAFLCSGAVYALDIIYAFRENGYQLGHDYGIMTFDQLDYHRNWNPMLTVIDNHPEQIGEEAGKLIIDLCNGKVEQTKVIIPYKLIEGNSL